MVYCIKNEKFHIAIHLIKIIDATAILGLLVSLCFRLSCEYRQTFKFYNSQPIFSLLPSSFSEAFMILLNSGQYSIYIIQYTHTSIGLYTYLADYIYEYF